MKNLIPLIILNSISLLSFSQNNVYGPAELCKNPSNSTISWDKYIPQGESCTFDYYKVIVNPDNAATLSGSGVTRRSSRLIDGTIIYYWGVASNYNSFTVDWDNSYTGNVTFSISVSHRSCENVPGYPAHTVVIRSSVPSTPAITSESSNMCNTVLQSAYTCSGVSDASGYAWNLTPQAGSVSGSSTTSTAYWNTSFSGTAIITVAATNACGSSNTSQMSVQRKSLPAAPEITGIDETCLGVYKMYSCTNHEDIAGWYLNNVLLPGSSGTSSYNIPAIQTGSNDIRVNYSNVCGTKSATKTISVIQAPAKQVISGPNSICQDEAQSTYRIAPVSGVSYNWELSNGTAGILPQNRNTNEITIAWNTANANDVNIRVSLTNNCGTTWSDWFAITRHANPNFTFPSSTACTGEIKVISVNASPDYTYYKWSNGVQGVNNNSITVNHGSAENFSYGITVTNVNGCMTEKQMTLTVYPKPQAYISGTNEVCLNECIDLIPASQSEGLSYLWSTGAVSNILSVCPSNNTKYTLTVTNAYGCQRISEASVNVNPLPQLSLSDISECEGKTVTISAPAGFSNYIWSNGQTGSNAIQVIAEKSERYSVIVSDDKSCQNSASMNLTVNPKPQVTLADQSICKGSITNISAPFGQASYQWSNGKTTNVISESPSATTNYSVTITNSYGCSSNSTMTLKVNTNPVFSLSNAGICQGESQTISAPPGYATYSWNNGMFTQSINVSPFFTTNYSLTVTDENGCTGNASMTLTVNPLPIVSVSSQSACQDKTVTFVAEPSGYSSYHWSTGQGNSSSCALIADVSKSVSVVVTDNKGCSNTASAFLTVNPLPGITLMDQEACYGDTVKIIAPSGFNSYEWSNGVVGTNFISVNAFETTSYSVKVLNSYNCTSNASMNLKVNPLPAIALTDKQACKGDMVSISASVGFLSYQWSNGINQRSFNTLATSDEKYSLTVTDMKSCRNSADLNLKVHSLPVISLQDGYINQDEEYTIIAPQGYSGYLWSNGTSGINQITVSPQETSFYIVTVTDRNACVNSDTMKLIVYDLPLIELKDMEICAGQSADIEAPEGYKSYTWSNGQTGKNRITVSPTETKTYTVEVTNETGGVGAGAMTLTVHPLPEITCWDTLICKGTLLNLETKNGYASYRWSSGDNTNSLIVAPEETNNYTIEVTSQFGCKNEKTVKVEVDNPYTDFHASKNNLDIGDFTQFFIDSDKNYKSYSWIFGDGLTSDEKSPLHYYYSKGRYNIDLTVTTSNNCTETISKANYILVETEPTETDDYNSLPGIKVYPVPFEESIKIDASSYKAGNEIMIALTDLSGKVISQKKLTNGIVNEVSYEDLSPGSYLLIIKADDKISFRKIFKE